MQINQAFTASQWLSLEEIRTLLLAGELQVDSPQGTMRLYVQFKDRASAQQLAEK
ncbi:MAG: hypothetical protein JO033_04770 [Acidobacteriaceae bacterium]|nr:hypothetical protein [Acidobacteriaceae bacterium]MBV9179866.1 hypothetical protein [Acidobacteriota bacterium]